MCSSDLFFVICGDCPVQSGQQQADEQQMDEGHAEHDGGQSWVGVADGGRAVQHTAGRQGSQWSVFPGYRSSFSLTGHFDYDPASETAAILQPGGPGAPQ